MPNKSEGIIRNIFQEMIFQHNSFCDCLWCRKGGNLDKFIEAIRQAIKGEIPKYDYGMPKEKCCWCKGKGNEWIDAPDNLSGYDYRYPCRCRKKLKTKHNQILFTIHTAIDKVLGGGEGKK